VLTNGGEIFVPYRLNHGNNQGKPANGLKTCDIKRIKMLICLKGG
jgi:hypothetical protein